MQSLARRKSTPPSVESSRWKELVRLQPLSRKQQRSLRRVTRMTRTASRWKRGKRRSCSSEIMLRSSLPARRSRRRRCPTSGAEVRARAVESAYAADVAARAEDGGVPKSTALPLREARCIISFTLMSIIMCCSTRIIWKLFLAMIVPRWWKVVTQLCT